VTILAIDPGPTESGWVLFDERADRAGLDPLAASGITDNQQLIDWLRERQEWIVADRYVFESISSYGMPVGFTIFQTVMWTGRFIEALHPHVVALVERRAVKLHVCGSARAKDANVRAALIDRYGGGRASAIGTKKAPGPLYGIKSHMWPALALAITFAEWDVKAIAEAVDRSVAQVLG
jgi:hypothetical protein